jgi:hypothetical protein
VFSPVDTDSSTGNPYIAISKAVRIGNPITGSLHSVVSMDVDLTEMGQSLADMKKRADGTPWSGYAYLVGSDGKVGLHTNTKCGDKCINSVEDAEFGSASSAEKTDFVNNIKPLLLEQVGNATIFKRYTKGGKAWVMSFSPIKPSGYMLVITVQTADLTKAADDLQATVAGHAEQGVIYASTFGGIMVLFAICMTRELTNVLAKPLEAQASYIRRAQETDYVDDMVPYEHGSSNPERLYDWPSQDWNSDPSAARKHEPHCAEMSQITDNLEEMQVVALGSSLKT